ncbi:hypothetical protein ONE63_003747 [Megalurothrips usitatus]|uniref:Uncharacterized protein n=1 Tax=Megalurothrips usitatus TaxID=439358 RepID=A0AAV7X7J6_9NEOP|nr:hypothetical protein ONE63_003747 [Megalurothrips usitatus]
MRGAVLSRRASPHCVSATGRHALWSSRGVRDSSQREADTEDGSSAGSSFETINMEGEHEGDRQPVNFIVGEEDEAVDQNDEQDEHHEERGDTFPSSSSFTSNSGMSSNRNSMVNMADLIERRRRLR